jgi:hypothetical protein
MLTEKIVGRMLLTFVITVFGCTSAKVSTDADPHANMRSYHTFRFTDNDDNNGQNPQNPLYHSSLLDNSIHAEIARQLERRGIVEDVNNPDMLVAYHTFTEKKQSSINNYYPMMYGGWAWQFYPWGYAPYPYSYWNGGYTRSYTEGTLIIDAIDARSNQLVWRGSISDVVDDPANLHRKVMKAVEVIFRRFPVSPGDVTKSAGHPIAAK